MVDADVEYTQTIAIPAKEQVAASLDAEATVTVHQNAYLMGFELAVGSHDDGDETAIRVELSRSGNEQIEISDNPDTIAIASLYGTLATQGAANKSISVQARTKIFFRAGDKLYLNALLEVPSAVHFWANAILFWRFHESEI